VDALKFHAQAKNLTVDEMYDAVSKKESSVDKDSFLDFWNNREKKPATDDEKSPLSDEDVDRVFMYLVDKKESISKESMTALLRTYMKISKDTVLTGSLSIKASDAKRRLEEGEVVELLGHPTAEGEVEDVKRVLCKALKDGVEGWVTLSGNSGSSFLEPYTPTFKVVKETIMTQTFELDSDEKDAAEPRKLRIGEIVEVLIWPMKEEKSGLHRLRCRSRPDGLVGWATATGNAGTVFLETM